MFPSSRVQFNLTWTLSPNIPRQSVGMSLSDVISLKGFLILELNVKVQSKDSTWRSVLGDPALVLESDNYLPLQEPC